MVDINFEENVKKAFKDVREDINSIKKEINKQKEFNRKIEDKINLIMEKINKIEPNISKKEENNLISHGKTSTSTGNDGVNHNNNNHNNNQQQPLTSNNNQQQPTTNQLEKSLKVVTNRELSVLMAIQKLEAKNGSATYKEIMELLSITRTNLKQYIMELLYKNFIYSEKRMGNISHYYISNPFKDQNLMDKLIKLKFGPNGQKRLFD